MTQTVFIDGEAGTTGLQIRDRLAARADLEVLSIDPARRKDADARRELLNAADAVVLCLPDDAAIEAVSMITSSSVKVVDASTAHRVAPDWAYGFAEMSRTQRDAIRNSTRVSNPGCYPTGFIGLVRPLVEAGLIPADFPLTVNAVSGYTGGGKGLIAEFEDKAPSEDTNDAFRAYGFSLAHKHLPEMARHTGLAHTPVFAPAVGRYAQGMLVEVPLQLWALPGRPSPADLHLALEAAYAGETFVDVASGAECAELAKIRAGAGGYVQALDPQALNNTNRMRLFVFGNADGSQARLVALLDNLGKGASGAAVQNLNLMLGLPEGCRAVNLRPATPDDAPALARILFDCFRISLTYLPQLHTVEENISFMIGRLLPDHDVWVAERHGVVVGYVAFTGSRIQHLYIDPTAQGQGVGPRLLVKAMEDGRPKDLWTFQQNARARRFYEARGFRAVEFTDGADNEEKMPDVRYEWTP